MIGMSGMNQSSLPFDMGDDSGSITVPKTQPSKNAEPKQSAAEGMAEVEADGMNMMIDDRYTRVGQIESRTNNYMESTQIKLDSLMEQWQYMSSNREPGAEMKKMEIDNIQLDKDNVARTNQMESDGLKQEANLFQDLMENEQECLTKSQRGQQVNKNISLEFS